MTNRNLVAGDRVAAWELELLPAGAQVERADDGWKVTSVPEVVESDPREDLAWELYRAYNPDTMLTGLSHGWTADKWRDLADYVSENFTRNGSKQLVAQLPDEVTDGDGDTWSLKSNGLYGVSWSSDVGSRTLEEIRERWGISAEVSSLARITDDTGDVWHLRSNGKYSRQTPEGFFTPEEIRERYGLAPLKMRDRDGDTWEQQSDGTYTLRFASSGDLSESFTGFTEQLVRDGWSPVIVVS